MEPNKKMELEAIKESFAIRWTEGGTPTLTEYVAKYPQFEKEITEFVLSFAELFAVEIEPDQDLKGVEAAMYRGILAGQSNAQTIDQRVKEISLDKDALGRSIRLPFASLGEFHRHTIWDVPPAFWQKVAETLKLTELRVQRMLRPSSVLANRASGPQQRKTLSFRELIELLHDNKKLDESDYQYWLAEVRSID